MKRPVVAVLIKGLGIGGAEKLVAESARHWDRSSFDYRVAYILPWKDQLVAEMRALDVPVACIGTPRGMSLRTTFRLRRQMSDWEAQLIHAHLPISGVLARLVAAQPVVYTEHNLVTSYRLPTRLANRLTYGHNRAVTAVSGAVAAGIARYPGPEVEVVSNGVAVTIDPAAAREVRRELGVGSDQPLVVHVGNIRPGKGHDTLVDATAALLRHRPDVTVVSVGGEKYSGSLEKLRIRAREAGLEGALRFLGPRRDALAFIAAADVYVNPSEVEGLPVTILEAMALGRPVVATAVGGVPELLEDGENGMVVPPGSPDALAEVIHTILESPDMQSHLGRSGAATVTAEYGLEPMVRAFEDIYRRVLA